MALNPSQRRFPCGLTRREAIWQLGGGIAGLALTDLLSREGFFNRVGYAAESAANPLVTRQPHFAPKATACIHLLMNGGPSQVDTFDYKPELEKYAGQPLPADRTYINSGGRQVG